MIQFRVVQFEDKYYPQYKILWLFWRNYRQVLWDLDVLICYDTMDEAIEHIHRDIKDIVHAQKKGSKAKTVWKM